jgi:hypothetical protein
MGESGVSLLPLDQQKVAHEALVEAITQANNHQSESDQ